MVAPSRKPATLEELLADPNSDRLEIVAGELVEKAMPSLDHSLAESMLAGELYPFNRRTGGPRGPGGWWLMTEIHTRYASGEVYCHDAAGWRRERMPEKLSVPVVDLRPDWVCEILSPKHEKHDLVTKARTLHAMDVPHYWILHPEEKLLLVHRWSKDGYVVIQRATTGDVIRAEPFDAIELRVGALFGDDD